MIGRRAALQTNSYTCVLNTRAFLHIVRSEPSRARPREASARSPGPRQNAILCAFTHGGGLCLSRDRDAWSNPIDLLYQTHAIAREVAKFTYWLRGHETPAQQSVLQQIRDPLAVFLVRLPTRHGFDVLCIHQQHLELLCKNVPHRLPVHSRVLHVLIRRSALLKPIGQLKQIVSECPE